MTIAALGEVLIQNTGRALNHAHVDPVVAVATITAVAAAVAVGLAVCEAAEPTQSPASAALDDWRKDAQRAVADFQRLDDQTPPVLLLSAP